MWIFEQFKPRRRMDRAAPRTRDHSVWVVLRGADAERLAGQGGSALMSVALGVYPAASNRGVSRT